jgi:hypothetical protein
MTREQINRCKHARRILLDGTREVWKCLRCDARLDPARKAACRHTHRVLVTVRGTCEVWLCRRCDRRIVVTVNHRQLEFEFTDAAA